MTKEIPLTQGKIALVDDEDYERVNQHRWYACDHKHTFYAKHSLNHTQKVTLHHFVLDVPGSKHIDHINNDGLDNRRCNLRITTQSQNLMNARKRPGCSSKYKGVHWDKQTKKWHTTIKLTEKRLDLGRHENEDDAARAYNKAAVLYFGEYARLNVIKEKC